MSVLRITKKGEAVLHKPSDDVDQKEIGTPKFIQLINDMIETMIAANGVGIAAPQIDVAQRIFIAESSDGPIALVNPKIVKYSKKKVSGEEGCLSIPGTFDKVYRAKEVTVEAMTIEGKPISFVAKGFFARIMQHETDHLDGLLYVDRIAEQKGEK